MTRRTISPALHEAQIAYMALTGKQISQTEVQRLAGALHGGASVEDAVKSVFEFFSLPIDWEAERRDFAEWCAKRCWGKIAANLVISTRL